jgi:hypothetical protein
MEQLTSYRIRYEYSYDDGGSFEGGALIHDCVSEDEAKSKLSKALLENKGQGKFVVLSIEEYDIMLEEEGVTRVKDTELAKTKADVNHYAKNYAKVKELEKIAKTKDTAIITSNQPGSGDRALNAFQTFSVSEGWEPASYLGRIAGEHPDQDVT